MADYTLSAKITGDAGSFKKACADAKKTTDEIKQKIFNVGTSAEQASKKSSSAVGKSLNDIARENGKTVNQIRSEVMKAANEYKKQGMSTKEAVNKAYKDIGYVAQETGTKSSNSMKQASKKIEKSTEEAAEKSKSSFNNLLGDAKNSASGMKTAFSGVQGVLNSIAKKTDAVKKKMQELGSKLETIGNQLTSSITKPALAAGTALAGISLTKGFTRLTAIDTAKAKLEALGNSANNVTDIMKSATASVKGTSYGLDEAATTAASAVAAGIKPGKDLTRYLSLTADAAATSGRSMAEMGAIFNKVQTSQAAYTEELNQLADSGIPIYQWLGEEAGLSAAEVKEMASEGQISSEMFLKAVEKNIGGAAKIVGEKSFSGALSNIWASIGRIGANFLDANGSGQGFFTQLKPLMVEFKDYLGTLEEKAAIWGQIFGEAFSGIVQYIKTGKSNIDGFTTQAQTIVTKLQPVIDVVKNIVGAFSSLSPKMKAGLAGGIVSAGPLISILGKVFSASGSIIGVVGKMAPLFGSLCGPIGLVVAALSALGAGFAYLITTDGDFKNDILSTFSDIGKSCMPIITEIADTLKNFGETIFPVVINAVKQIVPLIANLISQLLPTILNLIEQMVPVITGLLSQILPVIAQLVSSLLPVISSIIQALMPVVTSLLTTVMTLFQQILPVITTLVQTLLPVVLNLITQLAPIITEVVNIVSELFVSLMPIVEQIMSAILPLITNIITVIANAVQSVLPAVVAIINVIMSVIEALMPVITKIISVVADVISNVINIISPIIGFIGDIISTIMEYISPIISFIADIIATIITYITPIIEFITGIVTKVFDIVSGVMNKVSGFISGVVSTISGIISRIANVFKSIFDKVYGIVKGIMDKVSGVFKSVIGAIQNAWSGLTSFVGGIFDGIKNAFNTVINSVKSVINIVIDGINGAIGLINLIPGVEIQPIAHLAHGTDNWQGGFAYMNEGGRGELVNLPNGSQVIPHDISVHYAKEAAKANTSESFEFNYDRLICGLVSAMSNINVHHTSEIDGKVVSETTSPLVDRNLAVSAMLERRNA